MENFIMWKTNTNYSIISYLNELQKSKYLLNTNYSEYDTLEKYIYDVVSFQLSNKNYDINISNYYIEFGIYNENDIFEYEDDKPILSIISFFNKSKCMFFTEIDIESYKYKDYSNENIIKIIIPEEFTYIIYNSSNYHNFLNINNKNDFLPLYLNIRVFDKVNYTEKSLNYYEGTMKNTNDHFLSNIVDKSFDTTIYDSNNLFCYLLYNETTNTNEIQTIIDNSNDTSIINMKILDKKQLNLEYLINKYGEIAEDIYPFYNKSIEMTNKNRFNNNKIIQNALPIEVCYWIINECEKQNIWTKSNYINYDNYLNIEKVPSVLNFVLFIYNTWIEHINQIYKLNIPVNITDIFISKCSNENYLNINDNKINDNFLTIEVQLNNTVDFEGGYIYFDTDEEERILLKQGDMIVYNGRKIRNKDNTLKGDKYIMVIFVELY